MDGKNNIENGGVWWHDSWRVLEDMWWETMNEDLLRYYYQKLDVGQ